MELGSSFTDAGESSIGEGGHKEGEDSFLESSKYAFPDYDTLETDSTEGHPLVFTPHTAIFLSLMTNLREQRPRVVMSLGT